MNVMIDIMFLEKSQTQELIFGNAGIELRTLGPKAGVLSTVLGYPAPPSVKGQHL